MEAMTSSHAHPYARLPSPEALPPPKTPLGRRSLRKSSPASRANVMSLPDELPSVINEEDWERYTGKGLLFPLGSMKFKWDLFILVLIIYSCISVPFRLGMSHFALGVWWQIEAVISLAFIADIVLTFNTAYIVGDQLLLNRTMIHERYLKSWFIIDAMSAIPMEIIDALVLELSDESTTGANNLRVLRALRLVRLLRLLRLLKLQKYVNYLEDVLNTNLQVLQLMKVVSAILYLTHLLGCFWFWLADPSHAWDRDVTWLSEYDNGSGLDADVWIQYLYSVYWALTTLTTVGYGDITPTNNAERGFALVAQLTSAIVFGYLLSTVASLVESVDPNAVRVQAKIDQVKVYCRWHKFPPDLATRVKRYFEFYYSRKSAMDEDQIVSQMAPTLRRMVEAHLCGRTVMKIPLFSNDRGYISLNLQLEVHSKLRPILREAREPIMESLQKGASPGASVFFARRGSIAAQSSLPGLTFFDIDASTQNGCGAIIGEQSLMMKGQCICTYRALTRCELYVLAIDDWFRIITNFMSESDDVDEMAEIIYGEFARRHVVRALALRIAFANSAKIWPVHPSKPKEAARARENSSALRVQACWLHRKARRMVHEAQHGESDLSDLVPGLYYAFWTRKKKKERRSFFEGAGVAISTHGAATDVKSYSKNRTPTPTSSRPASARSGAQEDSLRRLPAIGTEISKSSTASSIQGRAETAADLGVAAQVAFQQMEMRMLDKLSSMIQASVSDAVSKAAADVGKKVGDSLASSFGSGGRESSILAPKAWSA